MLNICHQQPWHSLFERKPLAQPQAVPMQSLTILDALRSGMAFEAWNLAIIRSSPTWMPALVWHD